jgi:flagellar motor switch protein FliN
MSRITNELLAALTNIQPQVWQTVTRTASDAAGSTVNFSDPLTVGTPSADLYAEMTAPKLVIQFAFATMPESAMIVLIGQDTLGEMAQAMKGLDPTALDESVVSELRSIFEAIVQGLAVGDVRNEPVVATGLSVRYQIFSFPPNLQKADEMVRTNVAISGKDFKGTATWLMDVETAHAICGLSVGEDQEANTGPTGLSAGPSYDDGGLEILLDIPLEVSVELGRVKMQVREVVELGAGSIVEIDKAAGEPVDVLVNGRLVARGEVVVIDDNFGVRITEILSLQERLQKLNEAA